MWLIYAWFKDEIKTTTRYADILYSCVNCANCKEHCVLQFKDDLLNIFEAAKSELIEEGLIPNLARDYLNTVAVSGNPYNKPKEKRAEWAEGSVPIYKDQEYLFYIGDAGSYDEVGTRMASKVAALLSDAGVSLGILGSEEISDGNDVKALGEQGLFEELAEKNIKIFNEKGIKKIITLDPHAFNVFKNEYPGLGGDFEVWHYTQIIDRLINEGKMKAPEKSIRVTYHDPCYLGRHNDIYDIPRNILKAVPGIELMEMNRNRENALCCGGGGGNFFTDILGSGEDSSARIRVREAVATGAEILAVACPMCSKMLDDAVKAEGLEARLKVQDIAEIVHL
jgi:Fe-S oxidoreductase